MEANADDDVAALVAASVAPVDGQAWTGPLCVECEDVPAAVRCQQCRDEFCALCYHWLHRKGNRARHTKTDLQGKPLQAAAAAAEAPAGVTEGFLSQLQEAREAAAAAEAAGGASSPALAPMVDADAVDADGDSMDARLRAHVTQLHEALREGPPPVRRMAQGEGALPERAKCLPLRLTQEERGLLKLLNGALEVSEYTDKVDVARNDYGFGFGFSMFYGGGHSNAVAGARKETLIRRELVELFSLVSGLYVSSNYRAGQALVTDKSFADNRDFLARVFELGRRYKITNPERMRTTYGKLMHMLQDAVQPGMLSFDIVDPIKTVYTLLKARGCLRMLSSDEAMLNVATATVASGPHQESQAQAKKVARQFLEHKWVREDALSEEDLALVLDSISDANAFLVANRDPVDEAIALLEAHFGRSDPTVDRSLAIRYGKGGSKLTHSHGTQFTYCMQTLQLWREIQHEMYSLWILTDQDLLGSSYRLHNTGQGLNRVQSAPRISRAMSTILGRVQSRVRGWVGLSVVHLGDRDVPNALFFIDKYTQVPRILGPVVRVVSRVAEMAAQDEAFSTLVHEGWGGASQLQVTILRDYFQHGFDGSGDDGGSCVDGRLTSNWNWGSRLEKKMFCHVFRLCGFEGFDGSFK